LRGVTGLDLVVANPRLSARGRILGTWGRSSTEAW